MILALVDDQSGLIMDWSAKAGATVATKMFLRHMGLLEEALAYGEWIHNYREQVFYRGHQTTVEKLRDPAYFRFKIVRSPFARATSAYIHAQRHGFFTDLRSGQPADMSFRQYVGLLDSLDIRHCNIHMAQQKKGYEYEIPGVFDIVCRLEEIEQDIARVNATTGLGLSLDGLGSDHHVRRARGGRCIADEPWSRIQDRLPDFRAFYTDDLVEKIRAIYSDDCTSYGYAWESAGDAVRPALATT